MRAKLDVQTFEQLLVRTDVAQGFIIFKHKIYDDIALKKRVQSTIHLDQ